MKDLSSTELKTIERALVLISRAELIEEPEFHSRMGVFLDEFRRLLKRWPDWDDKQDDSSECLAINNTLNDLLHGVSISEDLCQKEIGVSRKELLRIYDKWTSARGWKSTGLR